MASSSELTRRKALKAMYSEVATNVRNGHGVAPLKKDGYVYNSIGITKYDPSPTNQNETAISNYTCLNPINKTCLDYILFQT